MVRAGVRGLSLLWALTRLLVWRVSRPDVILVQNPPGVPALLVAWFAARMRSARFIIDWHNLTWSMLALRTGARHPLVLAVSAYERFLGRRADDNLFVSVAMRQELASRWGLVGSVFRDRPAKVFQPLPPVDARAVRARLLESLGERSSGNVALIVTGTSWTADEDFALLLDALVKYDRWLQSMPGDKNFRVVVLITGRGPLREVHERRFADAGFRHIGVHAVWLESEEYPRALAAADLGVCVHRSSSGLDLPMKVLDMFGAGIPVCALNYGQCLRELVIEGENGLLFQTSEELEGQLRALFNEGTTSPLLARLRAGVASTADERTWQEAWKSDVWPLIEGAGER
jgi:beta-1,4-mannosyltransferase